MGYDSLSGKTDEYVKDKEKYVKESEEFLAELENLKSITSDVEGLDADIQQSFRGVESEFSVEQERLNDQQAELGERKKELSDSINQELGKLTEANGKLDSLVGKRYADGASKASEKCKEYIGQLEDMLDKIDSASEDQGVVSGVADTAGSNYTDSGWFGRRIVDYTATSMNRYSPIIGAHSIEMDLIATNPNFTYTYEETPWNNNCQRCVSAYEARRRGYDVEAQPRPSGNDTLPFTLHPQGWPSVYKDAQLIDCSANSGTAAAMNVEQMMESWGSDCRAIVRVGWKEEEGGGGHVFIAERTNGITRFIDPQNGNVDASSYFNFAKGQDLYCMRIDNLDFTDRIHQCCQPK